MRLVGLILAILTVCATAVLPQYKVSLNDAIEMALKNNAELAGYDAAVNKARIEITGAEQIPNPSFSFAWENLKLADESAGEWVAAASMPLNFLWERQHDIASKNQFFEAQKLLRGQAEAELIIRLKTAYMNYHQLGLLVSAYDTAVALFSEIEKAAEWRVKAGDISEYELQRIRLETKKYRNDLKLLQQERDRLLLELCVITGAPSEHRSWETESLPIDEIDLREDEIIELALKNRFDLKAIDMMIESERRNLSLSEVKKLPDIGLEAGYKRQFDNFAGPVIQLSVEIPLFDKSKKETELANEEIRNLNRHKTLKTQEIITRIRFALAKHHSAHDAYESDRVDYSQGMLATASLAYSKGELSLVEFLDGVDSFISGVKMNTELMIRLIEAHYELENAVGIKNLK
ncbi:MAG: TolC family protein [Ignavibacteriales bacterium]|nr:MAG: TolC family protein [Ignavibacteriaceae bacterium]MBW7873730.1 TolC family protein [Ignavibacteria bacterium]MCZ2143955.1 TolC family protein [Ignavibacteriales bacterium]MBV6444631.1 hypothetical protein [Ignavibacteriaceae bacterium]MBZ0195906.1 TolC family protein [Ignavibacteriaceae bacterium]